MHGIVSVFELFGDSQKRIANVNVEGSTPFARFYSLFEFEFALSRRASPSNN